MQSATLGRCHRGKSPHCWLDLPDDPAAANVTCLAWGFADRTYFAGFAEESELSAPTGGWPPSIALQPSRGGFTLARSLR